MFSLPSVAPKTTALERTRPHPAAEEDLISSNNEQQQQEEEKEGSEVDKLRERVGELEGRVEELEEELAQRQGTAAILEEDLANLRKEVRRVCVCVCVCLGFLLFLSSFSGYSK